MRTVSTTLAAAQARAVRIPYIKLVFTNEAETVTYEYTVTDGATNKVLSIEHNELSYGGDATIVLNNRDRTIPALNAFWVEIGYGDYTGVIANGTGTLNYSPLPLPSSGTFTAKTAGTFTVTLPTGGSGTATSGTATVAGSPQALVAGANTVTISGTGTFTIATTACYEYALTPRLWVRNQTTSSSPDGLITTLYLTDAWGVLDEQIVNVGVLPYHTVTFDKTSTPYALMTAFLLMGGSTTVYFTMNALVEDDGIINTFKPYFVLNNTKPSFAGYETWKNAIYRLIMMTKSYLKALPSKQFEVVYPQSSDAIDVTYYSNQLPYFYEYHEKVVELIPNHIKVFCNGVIGDDGNYDWTNMITGDAQDTDAIARVPGPDGNGIIGYYFAPKIDNQTDADNRAAAILARLQMETYAGSLVVFHDCRLELYDRVLPQDWRGY